MSVNPIDLLFEDKRPIAEMAFGGEEKTPEAREETAKRVREILTTCGIQFADDINRLGCTGVIAEVAGEKEAALATARFLRLGLSGGGVGLPCFVPISRYCLVHETIGGLEPGQMQRHAEYVKVVSRDLTPEEKGKVKLVEMARLKGRRNGDLASDILGGREESLLEEVSAPLSPETPEAPVADAEPGLRQRLYEAELAAGLQATAREQAEARAFKCPEHIKLNWACRHCIAQAIVEGELETKFHLFCMADDGGVTDDTSSGGNLAGAIEAHDKSGSARIDVYARVATFTRKLSRD